MTVLSVRLNKKLEEKIEYLLKNLNVEDKSSYIRQLLELSLNKEILDFLSQKVTEGEISAWKAAELADISLRKMLRELKKRKIPTYTESMLEEDLQYVLRDE